jgi:hypothetical membrane protein
MKQLETAGLLLFIAGFTLFMGIVTSEVFYTLDFSSRNSYISELAAALPDGLNTPQPSGNIFNSIMMLSGLMIIIASFFITKKTRKLLSGIPICLFGVGILGVGIFPGYIAPWHGIFAFTLFLSGGLAAITSFKIVNSPLRYVFIIIGIVSLTILFSYNLLVPSLGVGGAERWVFYPLVF